MFQPREYEALGHHHRPVAVSGCTGGRDLGAAEPRGVRAGRQGRQGSDHGRNAQRQQPPDRVYALLQEKTKTCLDVKVQRTAYVGYVERSSSDYNPTLELVGKDRFELGSRGSDWFTCS